MRQTIKRSSSSDSISMGEAFAEFMMEKQAKNLSPATIRNYEQSMEFFNKFNEIQDDTPLNEISPSMFYKWINTLKLDNVKPTSINHYLRDCRTFFYWCMDSCREYIEPFKIQLISAQEEQLKIFTDDDILALLEKPRNNDTFVAWRTWAIVNWVLGTGNRASTIVEVRIGDIDFLNRVINLRHTKNKKAQQIPLSSSTEGAIKEYIRIWRKGAGKNAFLFCNIGEEQLTTNSLRHAFSRYCKDRGVEQTNIHGLRHNFARGWVQRGGNTYALQQVLGHSSQEMTRHYVKLFAEDIKEDYDDFSLLDTIKKGSKRTKKVSKN